MESENTSNTVKFLFTAQSNRTLNRNATFNFVFSQISTATPNIDFTFVTPPYLTFPAGSSGNMTWCIEISITGDDSVENNESVVYDLIPMYDLDTVSPSETGALTLNIIDNDGKCDSVHNYYWLTPANF
jgi:hypothetical protein